jgi:histidine triad (HIT) family protein
MSESCLFCRIVRKEIDATIVHEDDDVVAFRDIHPQAPTHVLVVPREHVATLSGVADGVAGAQVLGRLMQGVRATAAALGHSAEDGYRVVFNCGERAAQSVFHLHVHLLAGRMLGWPPG